ncbi:MAG: O-methyltransferase [Paludibacter sp.]
MKLVYRIYYFIIHLLTARNSKGFGVHSPYLFQFTNYVLLEKNEFYIFNEIEKTRQKLLTDKRTINTTDYGTGTSKPKKVSEIAQSSLIKPKYGQLLFRTINYLKLNNLIELGTSLGISTAYIASTSSQSKCISLEGCEQTANVALETFKNLDLKNVEVITGNIDNTIHTALNKFNEIDFVFVDANHSYHATLKYFEIIVPKLSKNAVVIFDDIYWSKEMKQAWQLIKENKQVTSTIDLFQVGICFFNPALTKKNYKMLF